MPRMLLNSDEYQGLACEASFSDHPHNELTFSGSAGSKKRTYVTLSRHNNLQMQSRLDGSARATTSLNPLPTAVSISGDISTLYSQIVRFQVVRNRLRSFNQELQSEMELLRKWHSSDLMVVIGQQATKRLKVKEMELHYVTQRNRELEEKVKQMAAESQVWFNYAKTNEAVVMSLSSNLDEVLTTQGSCLAIDVEEGYGDSGGEPFQVADEAEIESATENQQQRPCRVCREREVCVLLLPSRHLCFCKGCESRIETCSICNSTMDASIQVADP